MKTKFKIDDYHQIELGEYGDLCPIVSIDPDGNMWVEFKGQFVKILDFIRMSQDITGAAGILRLNVGG